MKLALNHHVADILKQKPALWGILGEKLIASLSDARVEKIDASLLACYPWSNDRYLIISTDSRLLLEVGSGIKQWLKTFITIQSERVIDALKRADIGYADYIVGLHENEEMEGVTMVVHLRPKKTENMQTLVWRLEGEARLIIETTSDRDD